MKGTLLLSDCLLAGSLCSSSDLFPLQGRSRLPCPVPSSSRVPWCSADKVSLDPWTLAFGGAGVEGGLAKGPGKRPAATSAPKGGCREPLECTHGVGRDVPGGSYLTPGTQGNVSSRRDGRRRNGAPAHPAPGRAQLCWSWQSHIMKDHTRKDHSRSLRCPPAPLPLPLPTAPSSPCCSVGTVLPGEAGAAAKTTWCGFACC